MHKKLFLIPALLLVPLALIACGNDDTTDDGIFDGGDGTTNGFDDANGSPNGTSNGFNDGAADQNGVHDFEGAESTDNGVLYIDETVGDGQSPTLDSEVEIHYQGMLRDGTLFDSSYVRGEPERFHLMEVIPGFAEGVLGMNEGGKRVMLVPSELGYGSEGIGEVIPPDADLIFEVELIAVR